MKKSNDSEALAVVSNNQAVAVQQRATINIETQEDLELYKDLDSMRFEALWETRTKPEKVLERGETFDIIDAGVADFEFEEGEETTQCIFTLQYANGETVTIFQKRTGLRYKMAIRFLKAKLANKTLTLTNIQMVEKKTKFPNAALIFAPTANSQVLLNGQPV